jgi:hypothetical protein
MSSNDADADPSEVFFLLDPGWKKTADPGSGIWNEHPETYF